MPKISDGLQGDPENEGWILGWAVYRLKPWDLYAVCPGKKTAQALLQEAGPDYIMDFGTHELGTEDFVAVQASQQ
jgi:glutaredoxin